MSDSDIGFDPAKISVIIPALNEAENLDTLLPELSALGFGQILICDNGSTDETRNVVERHGATWVYEPKRGYGAACYAGMEQLDPNSAIVLFMDADLSHDVELINRLADPIERDEADFVLGARDFALRESGSTTLSQRFANRLFPYLMYLGWGHRYQDMGPFRAIRRTSLDSVNMQDRAYGWTIEMQIRAVELGLRIREIAVPHRKRKYGRSKITGTVRGVALAAYWIILTCGRLWLTKRRRLKK